jgi:putative phosphoesterase
VLVAALYDIHGNVPALEAVLAEPDVAAADVVVIGGDAAAGPFPAKTLERLRALEERAVWLRGNCDRELADDEEPHDDATTYSKKRLHEAARSFLAALPESRSLEVGGVGSVLFCHGSPRADDEFLTMATPDERLREALRGVLQPLVVCGHSHHQFVRELDGRRVVNAGSVGTPYADEPGAYWLVLRDGAFEHRRTPYDLDAAERAVCASGYPAADEFVRKLRAPERPGEAAGRIEQAMSAPDDV